MSDREKESVAEGQQTAAKKQQTAVNQSKRSLALGLQRATYFFAKYWFAFFMAAATLFLMLGFLAPALLAEGYENPARTVYAFMGTQNHQLPQRSYFLLAKSGIVESYSLMELVTFGADPENLQSFLGNAQIGYKTALNHRMIAIFVGIIAGGFIWALRRGRPQLSLFQFLLMVLPLLLDGFTHMVSENGSGFRSRNGWFAFLTAGSLSASFYTETTPGSLNWWLRTVTGLLFGLGLVWYFLPIFGAYFEGVRQRLRPKLNQRGNSQAVL